MKPPPMPPLPQSHVDFHKHLEECPQCAHRPFELCATGDRLIRATITDDAFEAYRKAYGALVRGKDE